MEIVLIVDQAGCITISKIHDLKCKQLIRCTPVQQIYVSSVIMTSPMPNKHIPQDDAKK